MTVQTINVTTAAELRSALAGATGGETILLAPGNYGALSVNKMAYSSEVTIASLDAANPASFSTGQIKGTSNLTLDTVVLDYTHTAGDPPHLAGLNIASSDHIAMRNVTFDGDTLMGSDGMGHGTGRALVVSNSSAITVENSTFYDWLRGAVFRDVQGLNVVNNEVTAIRSDGFDFTEVQNVLIQGNYLHDFNRDLGRGDHADMIQFFSTNATIPSANITIRGNVLDSGGGYATQSIFMRNEIVDSGRAGQSMFYQNIVIEDNLIYNGHLHGITVGATDGLVIDNNTVLQNTASVVNPKAGTPYINVNGAALNVTITDNITHAVKNPQGSWNVTGNLVVQQTSPSGANYYGNLFADPFNPVHSLDNLDAVSGGLIEQTGVGAAMTRNLVLPPASSGVITVPAPPPPAAGGTTGSGDGSMADTGTTTGGTPASSSTGSTGDTGSSGSTGDTGSTGGTGDTGSTGGGSDGSSNGSGAGETAPAGHHHYVTLGKGAHTVSGDLSALDGTVYKRFGTDDSITLTGAATAQSHITVKKRRAVVDVDLDNDGTPDGTIVLKGKFKHGDFLATHSNGDMVVTYHDAIKFRDGRPLDVNEVGGIVNQAYLNGDNAHSFQVTLGTRAKTGYRDTVGAYEVDANGNIVDVRILTANAKADAGNSFIVDNVESGHDLGFFLVQNGGRTLDSSTLSSGNLSFVQLSDGTMALADNGVVIGNAHTFLSHDPALNFDGAQHVVSGADRDGGMMIGFEDTDYLSGHHPDDDFQDVLLNVEALYGFGS